MLTDPKGSLKRSGRVEKIKKDDLRNLRLELELQKAY